MNPGRLALALYRRELAPWTLAGCALGLVEGATAAVLVKRGFAGHAHPEVLNLAAAFVSGSPALANLSSVLWANLAHGRERVRLLVLLLAAFGAVVGFIGLLPRASTGLALAVLSVLVARIIWSGILTVRASVWSANYPRAVLARITGRIVVVTSLGMAGMGFVVATVVETRPERAPLLYLAAGLATLVAALLYRRVRVRRMFRLLREERGSGLGGDVFSLAAMRTILAEDPAFRRFMTWMAFYGAGNLMIFGQLVIVFTDQLQLPAGQQVMLLTILPLACVPLFTPLWARLFDAGHVVQFRARQCWTLVAAMGIVLVAVFANMPAWLWLAAIFFGASTAGAHIGWNLGHNDFASLGKVQQYMGVNVTLTGLRGLIAPPLGAVVYTLLERRAPGAGRFALLLPLGLTVTGAIGFNRMKHDTTGPRHP
jgi:hypothetical protein